MAAAARSQAFALIALAAACGGLGIVLYGELADFGEPLPVVAAAAPIPSPRPPAGDASFSLPPLDRFAEVAARPLLSPTRRPPAAQAAANGDLSLAGIVLSPTVRIAIIGHGTPALLSRVGEGQEIEGWTVRSIMSDRVVLERGGEQQALKLVDRPAAKTPQKASAIDHSAPPKPPSE